MDISWLGNKSFMISDEIISVVVNPNDSILSSSEINENTVIISTNSSDSLSSDLPIVDSPGEYEVNNGHC